MRTFFLILSTLIPVLSFAVERPIVKIAQGLSYSQFICKLDKDTEIELQEIQFKPNSDLQMRVISNSGAIVNADCMGNYGGTDLHEVMKKKENSKVFAATNGNFFRTQKKSNRQTGYVPTGLLWSKISGSAKEKTYEALRVKGGNDLLIVDHQGAHQLHLKLETCGVQTCASLANPEKLSTQQRRFFSGRMKTPEFLKALRLAFPRMTLASQMTMDLTGGQISKEGRLVHYSLCESKNSKKNNNKDDDVRSSWKCKMLPRTFLCGKRDGSISLFTTPSAYVYDIARGMRVHGKCSTECEVLFNLDGGGSTQMGYRDPKTKKFNISGVPHGKSFFGDPEKGNQKRCGSVRPVDHYFAIGR
jgi:hypothetical protein